MHAGICLLSSGQNFWNISHQSTMARNMRIPLSDASFQGLMRQKKTLFDHTADSIFKNLIMLICKDADFKLQIECLPKPLRATMLSRLTKLKCRNHQGDLNQFTILLKGFEALITTKTTEIELDGLLTFCPDELKKPMLTQVVQKIVNNAPDLEILILNERRLMKERENVSFYGCIQQDAIEIIGKLRHLKKLCIKSCAIDFSDLLKLCKKLPALEHLDVYLTEHNLTNAPADQSMFRESFGNLKVFLFAQFSSGNFLRRLTKYCIENLPHLEIVQSQVDSHANSIEMFGEFNLPCESSPLLHLSTQPCDEKIHLRFPNVTHLKVNLSGGTYPKPALDALMNFSHIEFLCVSHFPSLCVLEKLLDAYGASLTSLELSVSYCSIKLGTIFEKCPKLEKLCLDHVKVEDGEEPIQKFSNLKELVWIAKQGYPVKISTILSAPGLEKISLEGSKFEVSDLERVADQISRKQILCHLSSFHHNVYEFINPRSRSKFTTAITSLFKNAIAFIPDLTDVSIDINFNDLSRERFRFYLTSENL
ncbi:Hypothetical predicted protein [Cloeon dipterum]|uniref:F-box domain-containing protein n=1 Tax=Cloeon dipterum TaxID=197152 RepID=A0A8S1DZS7_9INSE|nr:Hypothetical predicted protein [Cloeon dipterum]